MIIELGHLALWIALAAALVQSIVPLWGTRVRSASAMRVADSAAQVQFLAAAASFGALTWAYVVSDFSLINVVMNSHSAKPML